MGGSGVGREGEGAGALPEGGAGFDVGEEGAGDGGEEGVEVFLGRGRGCVGGVDFADGEAGDGGLGHRPEEGRALVDGDETLG